ncbi:hypothetical protein [Mesorhizobium sp. SP-1A]|uniref:hypothetical protein n=1 Tax=Mesorhizobium sp. SP-1A TaxID=3077840 RepID=UPI0028F7130A|nr:hypothetical protein [Mesorhizobium sp. SP-1A]
MIIYMDGTTHFLKVSKTLKKALDARGIQTKLSQAQEMAARVFGYSNRHELKKTCTSKPASAWDDVIPAHEAKARHVKYVERLVEAGVPLSVARDIISDIAPTSVRRTEGEYDWVLMHNDSHLAPLSHWIPKQEAFKRTDAYKGFQYACYEEVGSIHWAENHAFLEYNEGKPWIYDLLNEMRNNHKHPIWLPSIISFLGRTLNSTILGTMTIDQDFIDEFTEAFAQASPTKVASLLEEVNIYELAKLFSANFPRILAPSYVTKFGRTPVSDDVRLFKGRKAHLNLPHRISTWMDSEIGNKQKWVSLSNGDLETFCFLEDDGDLPATMYFRKVFTANDPKLLELADMIEGLNEVIKGLNFNLRTSGPHHIRDIVLIGRTKDKTKTIQPCGIFEIEHCANLPALQHVTSVPFIHALDRNAAIAAIAAICMSTIDVRSHWPSILLPGMSARLSVEVGDMEEYIREMLYDSLSMEEGTWEMQGYRTYDLEMIVTHKGKIVDLRR